MPLASLLTWAERRQSKGFNQMPAQAANGVSEAQVHAAVDYMIAAAS